MYKFNIIEAFKLLKTGVYLFFIFILVRAGVYHTSVDILEKVVTPSEKKIHDKNLWANIIHRLKLAHKHRKETNIRVITKKYNTYYYSADSRRHSKYNPLNPYSLKTLRTSYKHQPTTIPENPIIGYKIKRLTREETVSILAKKRNTAIETLKANAYCKQFYIKNYPEIFDTQHKFDTAPTNTGEWVPVIKNFIDGLKIRELLEYYYSVSIEPVIFSYYFHHYFWAMFPGLMFWTIKDMKAVFDFVHEFGLGLYSSREGTIPFYISIWNYLLEDPDFVEFWKTFLPQDELDLFNASLQDQTSTSNTDSDSGDDGKHQ